jgi:hypothetical protein
MAASHVPPRRMKGTIGDRVLVARGYLTSFAVTACVARELTHPN